MSKESPAEPLAHQHRIEGAWPDAASWFTEIPWATGSRRLWPHTRLLALAGSQEEGSMHVKMLSERLYQANRSQAFLATVGSLQETSRVGPQGAY